MQVTAGGNGDARIYFVAGEIGGEAHIRIRADRGVQTHLGAETTRTIRVLSDAGPVASLEFTGPYIEAIRTNRVQFGPAVGESVDFQNGTYSRVVSITARDANGNPVPVNTPIHFRLIDAPLVGYPQEGSGRFEITGNNGNPLEGGFNFNAPNGNFLNRGARVGDRLVLDPDPNGRSFYHAGIRTIAQLPPSQRDTLVIRADAQPFRVGEDQGATVPYVIGRAQAGSIQSLAFTDGTGTASALLTYPFSNVGRTAIIVAHTEDFSVSRVFNPGGAVYLRMLGDDGTVTLTASTAVLPAQTGGMVTLCLRDKNGVPLSGQPIFFSTENSSSGATANILLDGEIITSGYFFAGQSGCVTVDVEVVNQFPGDDGFKITFNSLDSNVVEVDVLGLGAGNLILTSLSCPQSEGETGRASFLYVLPNQQPIPGVLVTLDSSSQFQSYSFEPPSNQGSHAGVTGSAGEIVLNFNGYGNRDGEELTTASGVSASFTCHRDDGGGTNGGGTGSVPGDFSGTSGGVIHHFSVLEDGPVYFYLSHEGSSNFIVRLLNSQGDSLRSLANEIGVVTPPIERVQNLDAGTYMLDVRNADGDWRIHVTDVKQ
ncbi:hypothetical protein [Ectothiorhodospira magna]|uniref:hypothetical protein n=1 Tax=Ectothiorhodospira magna TaxID=867345 RepID=UPI001178A246|nr:hypothetical protein [Ectothiorhodospira magna]